MSALDTVAELKAQLKVAEEAAAGEIAAKKQGVMEEIVGAMKDDNISLAELSVYMRVGGSKYSKGTDTWSGKGKKPAWLEKELAAGKKVEDFLTVKPTAAAT